MVTWAVVHTPSMGFMGDSMREYYRGYSVGYSEFRPKTLNPIGLITWDTRSLGPKPLALYCMGLLSWNTSSSGYNCLAWTSCVPGYAAPELRKGYDHDAGTSFGP